MTQHTSRIYGEQQLSTVERHQDRLLGSAPCYTLSQLAKKAGTTEEIASEFWLAMGFPKPESDEVIFSEADIEALTLGLEMIESDVIDKRTWISLLRAQSHITDRLVLWELEALVEDRIRRWGLDDTSARIVTLDRIMDTFGYLERHLGYARRRQMSALLSRIDAEVSHRGDDSATPEMYPLLRSLGFVDMVAYTRRSADLGASALGSLVEAFDTTARNTITASGARLVKSIGDAVLYIADDLETGAETALNLMEELEAVPEMLSVRASLVYGHVLSRSGDIFGPPVNIASRLVDVASPSTVLMDEGTAKNLRAMRGFERYVVNEHGVEVLKGVGEIRSFTLERNKP
ncbi:MAG: adenylate/guanylate cyclase domain-containing protein [Actinomycetaceae bacterium]|nr:adenylate/guanylate cyclase domain-containing protein [Actinomycetaceae bacterium]